MTDLKARQTARNRETQSQPSFTSHREQVMRLISEAVAGLANVDSIGRRCVVLPTLTVIGAGNCQDIDLQTLATLFREIRLVDIDPVAVNSAVSQFASDVIDRIRVFAPVDIAAPLMAMEAFDCLNTEQRVVLLKAIESLSTQEDVPVSDVVVSTCLLSQLMDSASQIVSPDSPSFLPLIQAVRRGHLVRMLSLTETAGRALLITDLVSSDTVPQLKSTPLIELPNLMSQCLQTGNFFSGLNPAVVQHDLQHFPACMKLCASSRVLPPWHWHLGPRSFAVYAVAAERKRSGLNAGTT